MTSNYRSKICASYQVTYHHRAANKADKHQNKNRPKKPGNCLKNKQTAQNTGQLRNKHLRNSQANNRTQTCAEANYRPIYNLSINRALLAKLKLTNETTPSLYIYKNLITCISTETEQHTTSFNIDIKLDS